MDPKLQRRVQRYGWDKAVGDYEAGLRTQLEPAQSLMLDMVALLPGEHVLDTACGTGLISFRIAQAVGEHGARWNDFVVDVTNTVQKGHTFRAAAWRGDPGRAEDFDPTATRTSDRWQRRGGSGNLLGAARTCITRRHGFR